ncbi:MAG: hypothetical protein V1723_02775 [Candidatus Uhrbacteria bacterium]
MTNFAQRSVRFRPLRLSETEGVAALRRGFRDRGTAKDDRIDGMKVDQIIFGW